MEPLTFEEYIDMCGYKNLDKETQERYYEYYLDNFYETENEWEDTK